MYGTRKKIKEWKHRKRRAQTRYQKGRKESGVKEKSVKMVDGRKELMEAMAITSQLAKVGQIRRGVAETGQEALEVGGGSCDTSVESVVADIHKEMTGIVTGKTTGIGTVTKTVARMMMMAHCATGADE